MSLQSLHYADDAPIFSLIKEISGKRIEERRRRNRITQDQLAQAVGRSVRWLREIEGGNPKSKLDDHLLCAHRLGLSTSHVLIPLLFVEHHMTIPKELLLDEDLSDLEKRCIALISEHHVDAIARQASQLLGAQTQAAR